MEVGSMDRHGPTSGNPGKGGKEILQLINSIRPIIQQCSRNTTSQVPNCIVYNIYYQSRGWGPWLEYNHTLHLKDLLIFQNIISVSANLDDVSQMICTVLHNSNICLVCCFNIDDIKKHILFCCHPIWLDGRVGSAEVMEAIIKRSFIRKLGFITWK